MKEKAARALAEWMEMECCCDNINLRENYSGRGMYGNDTFAISGDFSWSDVAVAWAHACINDDDLKPDDLSFTWDAMGLGTVIY